MDNTAKIALVTGASKGIGAEIARTLAREGFDIWLNYRSNDALAQKVNADIETIGTKCDLLKFDVADYEQSKTALEPFSKSFLSPSKYEYF